MSAELAATFYTMGYAQSVAQSMENNQADILVLTPNQYFSILQDKSRHNPRLENTLRAILANTAFGQYWTQTVSPNASEPWVGPTAQSANDALAITKTLNAIGEPLTTPDLKCLKAIGAYPSTWIAQWHPPRGAGPRSHGASRPLRLTLLPVAGAPVPWHPQA
ncbi:hypothetical protein M4R22_17390 [Acidovorax sp. GBBC 3334]|uniref:hypothetical protein n=1 Tax=Acidovorax sp. GBBC 3334 TaxID=2940496 RepID=UPI002302AD1E|nr:hypothetical protein [Acidovorax sp. GBBC 3334]MDA8456538.1 hypothetical protein [Acidovorax sp. GBBC 3334]